MELKLKLFMLYSAMLYNLSLGKCCEASVFNQVEEPAIICFLVYVGVFWCWRTWLIKLLLFLCFFHCSPTHGDPTHSPYALSLTRCTPLRSQRDATTHIKLV